MGWQELRDNDFKVVTAKSTMPGTTQTTYSQNYFATGSGPVTTTSRGQSTQYSNTLLVEKPGAYAHVSMDLRSGTFYVYGLLGPKAMNKSGMGNLYEGFYIYKFNQQGTVQWRLEHSEAPELSDEKFFNKHGMPADRHINLLTLPKEMVNFNVRFKKTLVSYSISQDGKVTMFDKNDDLRWLPGSLLSKSAGPVTGTSFGSAQSKNAPKQKPDEALLYSNFVTTKGQTFLEVTREDGKDGKGTIHLSYYQEE